MCSAAKLQAAANEPEAGFGMDVRGGLGGGVPAPSLSAASALVAGFCEGSSISDFLERFIYMRIHILNKMKISYFLDKF